MSALFVFFGIVVSWILIPSTEANRNQCPISANINEFHSSFETLKDFLYTKDTITDVTLLKAKDLKHIQPFEKCCFLHNLGNFYVGNVFPVLELTAMEQHRNLFHLANSVLSLTKELNKCGLYTLYENELIGSEVWEESPENFGMAYQSIKLLNANTAFRCPCGEQSHAIMQQFKDNYFKITTTNAAIKAIGELNILFHWIERNFLP
ncbi:interleukin-19-like [Anomaloglossus baeobatrachus]|uniref:interleukin-19-like n=1 Tax=Anomaloglossus baeobatrachus TaxID=238106 RepID=UPI003F5061A5